MLFKLSIKNIQKSMKDYTIYFFTLIIGVAIFYVFNAIDSQTVMMDVTSETFAIIKLMTRLLSGVSVFVSFVLGFLIIYASRFLMKRRNKEFGLYLLLGMGKRKISWILFFETLLIGLISLVVGLIVGVGASQLMSVLVVNMFEADMTKFQFVFSKTACWKSVVYFGIMYGVVIVCQTWSIRKCRLIELLQAGKKSEKVKMKNPWVCIFVFFIAVIALGYAYYTVTVNTDRLTDQNILVPIALGAFSTFFIFWSLSGLVLKVVMSVKQVYYKGLNSFILRQVSSQINTAVFSMTVICLMLFVTICVLASSLSVKKALDDNLNTLAPADIELCKDMYVENEWLKKGYTQEQIDSTSMTVLELYHKTGNELERLMKDWAEVNIYTTPELTFGTSLGSRLEMVMERFRFLMYDTPEQIISVSDYNKMARLFGKEEYTLEDDEYCILGNFQDMMDLRNEVLALGEPLKIFDYSLTPKYSECKDGFLNLSSTPTDVGFFVVPDYVVENQLPSENYFFGKYDAGTKTEAQRIEMLIADMDIQIEKHIGPTFVTRTEIAEAAIGLGALVTFIGLYLGLIFLISSAAIFALKQLSESTDNIERFRMLRKIGVDEAMMNRALFRQIAIFFLFPLTIAMIHSYFGMKFSAVVMQTVGAGSDLQSLLLTGGFLVLIYGGYFIVTYLCSKSMIREIV